MNLLKYLRNLWKKLRLRKAILEAKKQYDADKIALEDYQCACGNLKGKFNYLMHCRKCNTPCNGIHHNRN